MIMSIKATYELDDTQHEKLFEGKGTTHKNVKAYLRSLGAKKIKTETICKTTYAWRRQQP